MNALERWRARMDLRVDREQQHDIGPWRAREMAWPEYVELWKRETDKVIADGIGRAKAGL